MTFEQSFKLNQGQHQTQSLALSQGMRQSILMLQLDAIYLTGYLQDISLENPLFTIKEHLASAQPSSSGDRSVQIKDEHQSLFNYLLDQVQLTMRDTLLRSVVIYLIEQMDPRGYLTLSDDEILAELGISSIELMDAKTLLQSLDPPGVGAQSLQECLLLQANDDFDKAPQHTIEILKNYFETLLKHDWELIKKQLQLSDAEFNQSLSYIGTLSAAPGARFNHETVEYIVPELRLEIRAGKVSLTFNKRVQPEIVFAEETFDQLKVSTDLEVREYIRQKASQVHSLEYNLQRRQDTLVMIGRAIIDAQLDFLTDADNGLKPLLLGDIAHQLQLAESTVSRAISGKYIQTNRGIFQLKDLLSRYNVDSSKSTAQLMTALKRVIAAEDKTKPLSDEKLAKMLHALGYTVARRTVAKYREQAEIPAAKGRRRK